MSADTRPPSFRSAVDPLVAGITGVAMLITAGALVAGLLDSAAPADRIGAGIALLTLVGVGLVVLPTRYVLEPDALVVQSGVLRYRVPYAGIQRLRPSRSLLASPAWSLDRLAVDYFTPAGQRRQILISPVERDRFLAALTAAADLRPAPGGPTRGQSDGG